jgi:hypothetical protein
MDQGSVSLSRESVKTCTFPNEKASHTTTYFGDFAFSARVLELQSSACPCPFQEKRYSLRNAWLIGREKRVD